MFISSVKVKSFSRVRLWELMNYSLPRSSIHGIFQARVLEWVAISFARGSSRPRDRTWVSRIVGRRLTIWATREVSFIFSVKSLSRVRLFATPWTIACHAPRSMGFSRQEYWSGLPFPSPGDLSDLGIEPRSPALQADALTSEWAGLVRNLSPSVSSAETI